MREHIFQPTEEQRKECEQVWHEFVTKMTPLCARMLGIMKSISTLKKEMNMESMGKILAIMKKTEEAGEESNQMLDEVNEKMKVILKITQGMKARSDVSFSDDRKSMLANYEIQCYDHPVVVFQAIFCDSPEGAAKAVIDATKTENPELN